MKKIISPLVTLILIASFFTATAMAIGKYGVNLDSAAYHSNNPFSWGQCTWYAWGRANEKWGANVPARGNAGTWADAAIAAGWPVDTNPTVDSIAVWKAETIGGLGHVAYVEKIEGDQIYISESNQRELEYTEGKYNRNTGYFVFDDGYSAWYSGGEYTVWASRPLPDYYIHIVSTISFNANGGSGAPAPLTKVAGNVPTIPATIPTRAGYKFLRWNSSPDGTGAYSAQPGDAWGGDLNITFYAIWQPTSGTLDLNGLLDGEQIGGLSDYGTCDVYINGSLAPERTNTTDYVDDTLPANTTYLITNIKANEGFSYDGLAPGSADLSGTIQAGVRTDVRLKFNSCTLTVNGLLDGTASDNLGNYGTFDLYVNGTQIRNDTIEYSSRLPKGATYEIKDIKANTGFAYKSASGSLTGTIKSGNTTVRLGFDAIGTVSEDWITVDKLPGNINSTICDIEYKHTYQTTAQSSPGSGWTQVAGSGKTTYENDGGVWETEYAQQESATLKCVGSYYYHYCGTGYGIEHFEDVANGYTTLHVAGLTNGNFEVVATQKDSCHDILQYELKHTAAPWEGQAALCNDGRSDWWYIKYQYQSKKAVTTYDWTKTTDWTSTKDSTASSVQYRYRLKSSLTKLALPANLTKIEDEAFAGTVMNAVIVPDSCSTIGSKAFANCSELLFVSVPKGTTIAADAFEGCGSVTVNER